MSATATEVPAVEVPSTEAPIAPEVPQPKVEVQPPVPKESARFAQLAKKERLIQARAAEVKRAEEEVLAKHSQYEKFEEAKRQAKLNPIAALESLGLTYDQLTEFVLNDNRPTPDANVKAVKDELDQLRKEQQEERKRAQEQEAERNVQLYFNRIDGFIKQNADTYELINANEAFELAHEVVRAHYDSTQQILTVQQAADAVEKHLEEIIIQKNAATKKFQAKVSQPKSATQQNKQSAQTKTISNNLSPTAASLQPPKKEGDRMARALAALSGAK